MSLVCRGYIYGMQSRMREYVSKTRELCRKFNLDHLPVVDADLHPCASRRLDVWKLKTSESYLHVDRIGG